MNQHSDSVGGCFGQKGVTVTVPHMPGRMNAAKLMLLLLIFSVVEEKIITLNIYKGL